MLVRSLVILGFAALGATAQAAPVSVIASDNFNSYATGALGGNNGGNGWAGAWTAPVQTTVSAVGSGDAPMSGNAIRFAPVASMAAAQRTLSTTVNAAAVAVEFMFQFDAGTINNNDFLALWFGDSTGPNIGFKANCGDGSCPSGTTAGADLFVRTVANQGGDSHAAAYSTPIVIGTTYTLFGLLEKTGSSLVYDRFSLWVDPTATERSLLTGADAVFNGNSSISSFSTIGFRTANFTGDDRFLVDALSIGVVPEPGSLALVGAAILGLGAARRKRV